MQVFGSKGWVDVGDVEHLTTWQMRVCHVDPANLNVHHKPQVITFTDCSTERAELEHFADAVRESRAIAVSGGDEVHGVAVLEAILESAKSGERVKVGARRTKAGTAPRRAAGRKRARKPAARKKPAK